jgi:hypothetical protein
MPKHPTLVPTLFALSAVTLFSAVASAQPARRPTNNVGEEKFRAIRLEAKPTTEQASKLSQMKNASVNLDPPSADDKTVLLVMARNYVYPVTHYEYYFLPDGPELVTRSTESPSIPRVLAAFRSQLIFATPGVQPAPTTAQLAYVREYGAAAVTAISEVLQKNPPPAVRINALRMLVMVAESGAAAGVDKAIELLKKKDEPGHPVDVLYYALKTAEGALGAYDRERGNKFVSKNSYFELVTLVDDVVQKTPACVIEKAYIPEKPFNPALSTDPKKADEKANSLQQEQVDAVQAFRLQAIRALGKVRTDIVQNETLDKERRPLYTLARVAVSDPAVVPAPSVKEIGEAVIGLATMVPSESINADTLGLVIARGVSDFVTDKATSGRAIDKDVVQVAHWKLYGGRLKQAFSAWEKEIQSPKMKLGKASKDSLVGLSQTATSAVFDPLSKQQADGGGVGVNKSAVDNWMTTKMAEIKLSGPPSLYQDKPTLKVGGF